MLFGYYFRDNNISKSIMSILFTSGVSNLLNGFQDVNLVPLHTQVSVGLPEVS